MYWYDTMGMRLRVRDRKEVVLENKQVQGLVWRLLRRSVCVDCRLGRCACDIEGLAVRLCFVPRQLRQLRAPKQYRQSFSFRMHEYL
jgi:hypothetical protein